MSSVLRILCGLAILVFTITTYRKTFAGFQEGGKLAVWGSPVDLPPGLLTLGFVVIGLVGALLIVLGIVSFLKSKN